MTSKTNYLQQFSNAQHNRIEALQMWANRLDKAAQAFSTLRYFLLAAQTIDPTHIDTQQLIELQETVSQHLAELYQLDENGELTDLVGIATQQYTWLMYAKTALATDQGNQLTWQVELDAMEVAEC